MKNLLTIIAVLFFLGGCSSSDQSVKVTYLNNCGFLYEAQNCKVIIDPFGTQFGGYFYLPSDSLKDQIMNAQAPFDHVDLLLITHIHGDHFDPFLAGNYLHKNSSVKMVCPPQVYQQMADSCRNFKQIKEQIISSEMGIGDSKEMVIDKVPLKIFRMQHGTDRDLNSVNYSEYTEYEKTENFGFLIHLNQKTIFHQGDGDLSINEKVLHQIDSPIDVAHLSFFDWDTTSYNLLNTKLKARNIIFIHGTKPAEELKAEKFTAVISKIIFFKQEMDSQIFD